MEGSKVNKRTGKKKIFLMVGAAAVIILAIIVVFWPKSNIPGEISNRALDKSISELYDEARADLADGKFSKAASGFRQLLSIKPRHKGVKAKIKKAVAGLYKEAVEEIKTGDLGSAKKKLDQAAAIEPKNKKIKNRLKEVEDQLGEENADPGESGGGADPGESGGGDPAALPKPIPPDALPIDLLVRLIDGYRTEQNGWLNKPLQAGSTYLPINEAAATQIDRILTTIAKYDNAQLAKERLDKEKSLFTIVPQNVTVNNHSAYFGLYQENNPDKFPVMTTLSWKIDGWFFSIRILPKVDYSNGDPTQPSNEYKLGIAKDVAGQLGY